MAPSLFNNLPECLLLLFVQFDCTKQEKTPRHMPLFPKGVVSPLDIEGKQLFP